MREKTIGRRKIYENDFLTVREDDVELPLGQCSKRIVIDHIGSACVLPVTDRGEVLLIEQYRYAFDETVYEIPAGKKDEKSESTLTCAKRELEEETGYQSENLTFLSEIYPCVGYSNEKIDLFLARDLKRIENPRTPDDDELIDVILCDRKRVEKLFRDGRIKDSKTIIALQYYLDHYDAIVRSVDKKG